MSLSEEESNFIRLFMVVSKVAPLAVRHLFDQKFPPSNLGADLQSNRARLNSLKTKRIITPAQWDLLFPPSGGVTCSTTYDVSLLICLLRSIIPPGSRTPAIPPPLTGFDTLPQSTDHSAGADLARIKHFRNFLAHHKEAKIARRDFNSVWTGLYEAIHRLGGGNYDQQCIDLRVSILDESQKQIYIELDKTQAELETVKTMLKHVLKAQSEVESVKIKTQTDLESVKRTAESDIESVKKELSAVKIAHVKYPSAIYKMDDESRKLYATALKEGLEVKREIRVIVVGKKAAGKTCLIKRLLSKSISDVTSTNGVDIFPVACEDETQFGDSWNEKMPTAADSRLLVGTIQTEKKLKDVDKEMKKESVVETDGEVVYQCIENDESPGSSMTSSQEGKEIPTSDEDIEVMETNYKKENIQSVEMLTDRKDDIETHLAEMTNAEMTNENEVRIAIWDFGGDEEFYYTHPVFLAHDVVFLIVTSLADTDDKSHGEFKFWFDTIHCLCNDREDSKELNPPCIVVGTHMDKCEPEDTADKLLFNKLKAVGDLSGHVFGEPFLISNTDYSEENNQTLKEIQKAIAEAAKKSKDWKAIHPLKFILLDKALEKEKTVNENKPTVAFDDIKHINTSLTNPLTDKELELYLQYNHATGHLIYYEDIPNYIVIKPQWLSDVFRCIVTADKFWKKVPLKYMSDWTQLRETGKVTENLLHEVFQKIDVENQHEMYLTQIMINFHIMIRLPSKEGDTLNNGYFAPCMIKGKKLPPLSHLYEAKGMTKSTCLCIEFDFLPPFLFNHMMIMFCDKYVHTDQTDYSPLFFTDAAIFTISSRGCVKLVLVKYKNIVQLQVLMFGETDLKIYCEIKTVVVEIIKQIIKNFCLRIKYNIRWKCQDTAYDCDKLITEEQCFCKEHNRRIEMENDWVNNSSAAINRLGEGKYEKDCIDISVVSDKDKEVLKTQPQLERATPAKIQPTGQIQLKSYDALRKASDSVGYLYGKKATGTCWRVGRDKIITAFHVVESNIRDFANNRMNVSLLKNLYIDFNFVCGKSAEKIKVEEKLVFFDEHLDVAILQLKNSASIPEALHMFTRLDASKHLNKEIYLISHDKGEDKKINYGIGLWERTEDKMEALRQSCKYVGQDYTCSYKGLESEERLVIKCDFVVGASGSPGIVINNDNEPEVAFIYLRGFPTFYYSRQCPEETKKRIPQECILQQGVSVCSVYEQIKQENKLDLLKEIFPECHELDAEVPPQAHQVPQSPPRSTAQDETTLTKEQLNFTRLSMLVTEVLADALYDLLPNPSKPRDQCDVTSLYTEHRNKNKTLQTPSSGKWGGVQKLTDIPTMFIKVEDDIERCRLIRNRLNHSSRYEIEDSEIDDLYKVIKEILTRLYNFMGLTSTPIYMEKAEEIKRKTYKMPDMKKIEEQLKKEGTGNVINYNTAEKIEIHQHEHHHQEPWIRRCCIIL